MQRLSLAEQGIWLAQSLSSDPALYNTAEAVQFVGKVCLRTMTKAIKIAVAEVPALNRSYAAALVAIREEAMPDNLSEWVSLEQAQPFVLTSAIPCRFVLLRGTAHDLLYMAAHHLVLDSFGYQLFWQRLLVLYVAIRDNLSLPSCPYGSYADLVAAEVDYAESDKAKAALSFWRTELIGRSAVPRLLTAPPEAKRESVEISIDLADALHQDLRQWCQQESLTMAECLVGLFAAELSLSSGATDLVLGLPQLNRQNTLALSVPCLQMNIMPLLLTLRAEMNLADLTRMVRIARRTSRQHQNLRHESIWRELRRLGPRDRLVGPVVNILPPAPLLQLDGVTLTHISLSRGPVLDLSFNIAGTTLSLCGAKSAAAEIAEAENNLRNIIQKWLLNPQLTLGDISQQIKAESCAKTLLRGPALKNPPEGLGQTLRRKAESQPNAIAIEHGEHCLNYAQFWAAVHAAEIDLETKGMQSGSRIGVALARSPAAIIWATAILCHGSVYVPLDPSQPAQRLQESLEAAGLNALVTATGLAVKAKHSASPAEHACLLFSSGSTGAAKGILIGLKALEHFVSAAQEVYSLRPEDRVLQFAPLSFDTSIEEIFVTLTTGASLILREQSMLSSFAEFSASIGRQKISVLDLPTAFWNEWVAALALGQAHIPPSLRLVILGGEAVLPATLAQWFEQAPAKVRLLNSYGPTEATIVSTIAELRPQDAAAPTIAIGTPLAGLSALVLGPGGLPTSEGELVLLGPNIGSRYLTPDLSLQREIQIGNATLSAYFTGDTVSRKKDGSLHYMGRIDNQCKISGYRVSPHELETSMRAIPGVHEAAVLVRHNKSERVQLHAFVSPADLDPVNIRSSLRASLPPALVPSSISVLPHLPKTAHGKLDRLALAQLQIQPNSIAADSQILLVQKIWQDILGPQELSIEADFYELGGHSLQVLQLCLSLSEHSHRPITVEDIVHNSSLGAQARLLTLESLRWTRLGNAMLPQVYACIGSGGSVSQWQGLANELEGCAGITVISGDLAAVKKWLPQEAKQGCRHILGHSRGGQLAHCLATDLSESDQSVKLWLLDSYLQQGTNQDLPTYKGRVWRFFAKEAGRYSLAELETMRRKDDGLYTGQLQTIWLEGDHYSLLKSENLAPLVAELKAQIHGEADKWNKSKAALLGKTSGLQEPTKASAPP